MSGNRPPSSAPPPPVTAETSNETIPPPLSMADDPVDGDRAAVRTPWSPVAPLRFEPRGLLGRGGTGEVREVRDHVLDRDVARKTLREERRSALLEARFLREARILARLEHPNIVPVYDLDRQAEDAPALIMRAVRGRNLGDEVASGRLPGLRERLEILLRVCEAVGYAHSLGVIHRDLKPGNVMIGDHGAVLVVDWGLARVMGGTDRDDGDLVGGGDVGGAAAAAELRLTLDGHVAGTPGYMSPEQASEGLGAVGPAADIYALGAILYFLLAGAHPWGEASWPTIRARQLRGEVPRVRAVAPHVPRELDEVVAKALHPDPAARYPHVEALRAELVAWLEGRPLASVQYSRGERLARWAREHRRPLQWVAAVVVVAVGLGVLGLTFTNRALQRARVQEEQARGRAEAAEHEALGRLLEAQLAQAASGNELAPLAELRLLLAARGTAVRLGRADEAVEVALSIHAHRSPPPMDTWAILTGERPAGLVASPSGQRAAVWGRQGTVVVFDPTSGTIQYQRTHSGVVGVGFDGEIAQVAVWQEGAVEVGPVGGPPLHRFSVAPAPPVDRIAVYPGQVDLVRQDHWFGRLERYAVDGRLLDAAPEGIAFEVKQSGRWLWGRLRDVGPCLYDRETQRCDPRWDPISVDEQGFVQVADDGGLIASISAEMILLEQWDHGADAPVWRVPALGLPNGWFAAERSLHLAWGQSDLIDVRRTSDGRSVAMLPVEDPLFIAELAGQDALLVLGRGGEVTRWALARTRSWEQDRDRWFPPVPAGGTDEPGTSLAVHEGAGRVAVSGHQGVFLFDLDLNPVPISLRAGEGLCRKPAFSPNGAHVAAACDGLGLVVFDTRDGRRLDIKPPDGPILRVPAFVSEAILGGWDDAGRWHTWALDSGQYLGRVDAHVGAPWDAVVTPEGARLSSGRQAGDHTLRIERAGQAAAVIPWAATPFGVGYDASTGWIWMSDDTGTVAGWQLDDLSTSRRFRSQEDLLLCLDAAAGRIVTGSYDGRIRIHSSDGRRLADVGPVGGSVNGVALTQDGLHLYYTGSHGVVGRYDLDRWAAIEAADKARRDHPQDPSLRARALSLRGVR